MDEWNSELDGLHDHDHHNSSDPVYHPQVSEGRLFSPEKWIAMGSLTFFSVLFGIFPYILFSYFRQVIQSDSKLCKLILALLSSISGGFLLATTMLHILPEVREKAEQAQKYSVEFFGFGSSNVPVAELLMLYGFCLIYGLEEIAQFMLKCKCSCTSHQRDKRKVHHHHHHHPHQHGFGMLTRKMDLDCDSGLEIGDKYSPVQNGLPEECQDSELITLTPMQDELDEDQDTCDTAVTVSVADTTTSTSTSPSSFSPTNIGSIRTLNTIEMAIQPPSALGALRSLISLLALSFHAVMEGIAVGVQDSSDLWMTFGAIASHKCIIALCLGMEMTKSNMNWRTLVASILLFSIVSPVGILIGSMLASSGEMAKSGWVVVIEGLASGTLLYIIFFEILSPDHHEHDHNHRHQQDEDFSMSEKKTKTLSHEGILRFAATCLGIFLAAYLLTITSHSHDHGHEALERDGLGKHYDDDHELEPHSH